jgi:uncharacterized protein YegP (UPF0339 family)
VALEPDRGERQKIATSGEGYKDKKDCLHAVDLVRKASGDKVVEEPVLLS